ncbi:ACP phosphodiesterase [Lysobacter brunescens]|uniref:ACP phosphodiesterase n=1 Tax=Lysobacter brunescens TaxID=262323 RepID=A0ABW2YB74_9GAMM
MLKQRFDPGHRRFAGIVLDLYFDHLLARAWPRYNDESLPGFCARVYVGFARWRHALPERAQVAGDAMTAQDWLGRYGDPDAMRTAVGRVATRLSRNGDALLACLAKIECDPDPFLHGFDTFFPQLAAFAEAERRSIPG